MSDRDKLVDRVQVARLDYRTAKVRYEKWPDPDSEVEMKEAGRLLDKLEAELAAFKSEPTEP